MGAYPPGVTEGVGYLAETVAPEHVRHRHDDLGSRGHGLIEGPINVRDVQKKRDRRTPQRLGRPAFAAGHFVGQVKFKETSPKY